MKITILNAEEQSDYPLDTRLSELETHLLQVGHQVTHCRLRELDIRYCCGCFGCWVKDPGQCVSRDESHQVCRAMIQADFVLWAAPMKMGFPAARLKQMLDKSIPLVHPYFAVVNQEAHHRARYERYPRFGLLLDPGDDDEAGDIALSTAIFQRIALNLKSRLEFVALAGQPVAEVVGQILMPTPGKPQLPPHVGATRGVSISPPARLTIFNGSPRGAKSNTQIMLSQIAAGFTSLPGHVVEMVQINRLGTLAQQREVFEQAECVLLGTPLYTDAMPGIVKAFIETLAPLQGSNHNPPMAFMIQSGFPEAAHSRYLEQYFQRLAARLGAPYVGSIVKGGCEGVHLMPEKMNRTLFDQLQILGRQLGESGRFDPGLLLALSRPERYPAYLAPLFRLVLKTPYLQTYWNWQLKENGAYERRFARPFAD